jgi:UDP-N-acetylglucosamine/UDP-N-acetylgalactosamine diphosphorylase
MQVDNSLGDPFSASLLSQHVAGGYEATVRCIERVDPAEAVGILLKQGGKVRVVEYTEIDEKVRSATTENGSLLHHLANISHFCFSLDFICRVADQSWPLHLAHKKIGSIDNPDFKAWKYEFFIFDCLPFAKSVGAILTPREECFAPLKGSGDVDGPEAVRAALSTFYRKARST